MSGRSKIYLTSRILVHVLTEAAAPKNILPVLFRSTCYLSPEGHFLQLRKMDSSKVLSLLEQLDEPDGVELPEVGNDSSTSSLRFFLGTGVNTASTAASTEDSELDSEPESESESEVSSITLTKS